MNKINAKKLQEMLVAGNQVLDNYKNHINELNVFPVPDGDTGSNMSMTFSSGVKAIEDHECDSVGELLKVFSKGLLMGARGNSGVILSQYFRGFAMSLKSSEELTLENIGPALQMAVDLSYRAVLKAVEGTILTVGREMYEKTDIEKCNTIDEFFKEVLANAQISLDNTPNLLPVLKEASVVDSGGTGLLHIWEGMYLALTGEEILKVEQGDSHFMEEYLQDPDSIEFGYCTEALIKIEDLEQDVELIRTFLATIGDSIVAIIDDEILKVHVHTETPLLVFEYLLKLGDIIHIKSENVRIQAEEMQQHNSKKPMVNTGIVAVTPSDEMAELFKNFGEITCIIGGQTLNPSIEEIVEAIKKTHARNVVVLPNNSNVVLAAEAAAKLVANVNVEIIPTKFMTQGLECLANYLPDESFQKNLKTMQEASTTVVNYEITKAIKNTTLDDVNITEGDLLLLKDGKIFYSNPSIETLLEEVTKDVTILDVELITVLKGQDGTSESIEIFEAMIEENLSFADVVTYDTNQPVYGYLISALLQ